MSDNEPEIEPDHAELLRSAVAAHPSLGAENRQVVSDIFTKVWSFGTHVNSAELLRVVLASVGGGWLAVLSAVLADAPAIFPEPIGCKRAADSLRVSIRRAS